MHKISYGKLLGVIIVLIVSAFIVACGQVQTSAPAASSQTPKNESSTKTTETSKEKDNVQEPVKMEKVVVGYPTASMTWFPIKAAYEKGFFKDEGLDLELVQMKGNIAIAALSQGDADYITHFGSTMRAAITNNLPVRAVFAGSGVVWSVVAGKNITSFDQLKGKTAGVNSFGSSEHVYSQMTFKHYGLELDKDIKFISLGEGAGRLAALEQGSIDVSLLPTPDDIRAEKMGFHILGRVADITKSPAGGLGTQLDRIKNNPEQIKKVVRAALKGLIYLRANKEEAIKIISEWVKLTPEEAKRAYELTVNGFLEGIASDEDILLDKELTDAGLTKATMEKVRDFTLVNQVRKELGLK